MKVANIMTRSVKVVRADTPMLEVVSAMCLYRISGLPVVEGDARLVGIVAEKDILAYMFPSPEDIMQNMAALNLDDMMKKYKDIFRMRVTDLMTGNPITVKPDMHILKASAIMASHRFRRIPVAESDTLVGMLSLGDVHKAIFNANVQEAIGGSSGTLEEVSRD